MKYFLLANSSDEKIIGKKYPQCKGLPSKLGLTYEWFEQPNSMTKLSNSKFPYLEPELIFELEEKAILTDVVRPSNIMAKGFLVNEKVKELFGQFNLIEHRYYLATVFAKGVEHQYYWLHFKDNEEYLHYADFSKSTFYLGNLARWKEENIEINSVKEFLQIKNNIGFKTINFDRLFLHSSFSKEPKDLFFINSLHKDYIVTENMQKGLQALEITGIEISTPKFFTA